MFLSEDNLVHIYHKTTGRCALCGSIYNLHCVKFIPDWTRVDNSSANMILMCDECSERRGYNFIELGRLNYVTKTAKDELMIYYLSYKNYLRKYVRLYGEYRTQHKLNIDAAMLSMKSYDAYIAEEGLNAL